MSKSVESKIKKFAENFLYYIHGYFPASQVKEGLKDDDFFLSLYLADNIRLDFVKQWADKKYYLILFYREEGQWEYKWELFLTRIIFQGTKMLWYLSLPRAEANKAVYRRFFTQEDEISADVQDEIKAQQEAIHNHQRNFKRRSTGFALAEDIEEQETMDLLFSLLLSILGQKWEPAKHDNETNYSSALEQLYAEGGDRIETFVLRRSSKYVSAVKEKYNFTCQACDFKLKVNGRDIIEVHHLKPLSQTGKVLTSTDDLICLCPTCHRVAHCKTPPYTTDEIKQIRRENGLPLFGRE